MNESEEKVTYSFFIREPSKGFISPSQEIDESFILFRTVQIGGEYHFYRLSTFKSTEALKLNKHRQKFIKNPEVYLPFYPISLMIDDINKGLI